MERLVDTLQTNQSPEGSSDLHARKTALDISRSFAVSAPAGSGKTSILVQRILRLLATADRPEEILAITFTRKAAAEMRQRILQALRDAAANTPVENEHEHSLREDALQALKRDQQQSWNLLENPERLRLQTIDGFCSYLTQRLCLETGSSHLGKLVERPRDHYQKAAEQLLSHIGRQDQLGAAVRHLVRHFEGNQDNLAQLLADLLDSRANWLDLVLNPEFGPQQLIHNFFRLVDEEISSLRRMLVHADIAELRALFEYALENLEQIDRLPEDVFSIQFSDKNFANYSYLASWKALSNMLLTAKGELRSPRGINKNVGFPPKSTSDTAAQMLERIKEYLALITDQTALIEQLNRVRTLPDLGPDFEEKANSDFYSDSDSDLSATEATDTAQADTLSALAICLPILAAELKLIFSSSGEADFASLSISALNALGETDSPTRLNLRLDYRIRHILVDEFQDTSSLQVSLLERLMAGWELGDGRTLFLVGDAMQSIYGFRKANVALFIRAREIGIGATALEATDLKSNFRSAPSIVEWVNRSFSNILPTEDDRTRSRVSYRTSLAQKPISPNSQVELTGYLSAAEEAENIADKIQEQLQQREASIAILIRARSHLRDIVPALKARNIRWQSQKIEPLGQRMHVLDLHSLVRALHCPADRIAWLSILRSPMLGLDMSDLYALADATNCELSDSIWINIQQATDNTNLSAEGKSQLARFEQAMNQSLVEFGLVSLRDLVKQLWQSLGGQQGLFKASYAQDIDDYLDLLESQSQGEIIADLEALENELDQLYARPDTDNNCQVKIMTIHAAKGLEFDHVHLPQLQRSGAGSQRNPALVWQEREYPDGHTAFLAAAKPAKNDSDPIYEWLLADERERIKDESCRLLYVACTRAKTTLHLSGVVNNWDEKQEEWKKPSATSLLSLLWQDYQEPFCKDLVPQDLPDQTDAQAATETPILSGIRRLVFDKESSGQSQPQPQSKAQSRANLNDPEKQALDAKLDLAAETELELGLDLGLELGPEPELDFSFNENLIQRFVGNILHSSFMEIAQGGAFEDIAKGDLSDLTQYDLTQYDLSKHKENWLGQLRVSGLDQASQGIAMQRLEKGLSTALDSEFGQWVLNPSHQESACELEIEQLLPNGSLVKFILDRTFVDQGTRWIIDYKSAVPRSDQSVEEFLQQQEEKYRDQLANYRSLFPKESNIKTLLYFPAADLKREVTF